MFTYEVLVSAIKQEWIYLTTIFDSNFWWMFGDIAMKYCWITDKTLVWILSLEFCHCNNAFFFRWNNNQKSLVDSKGNFCSVRRKFSSIYRQKKPQNVAKHLFKIIENTPNYHLFSNEGEQTFVLISIKWTSCVQQPHQKCLWFLGLCMSKVRG